MSQTVNWCYLEIPFRKPGFQQLSSSQLRCRLTPIAIWAVSPTWGWQYICWRFIRALCGLATSYELKILKLIESSEVDMGWHGSRLVTQPHMTWDIYVGLGQILHPKCYNHIFILSFLRVTQTCHLWSPHPMPLFRCMSDWVSQDLSRSTCKAWCLNGETNLDRAHGS